MGCGGDDGAGGGEERGAGRGGTRGDSASSSTSGASDAQAVVIVAVLEDEGASGEAGERQPLLGEQLILKKEQQQHAGGEEEGEEERPSTPLQVYAVSVAFLVLFLAYNSLQNYTTSLLPNGLGNESLAILYISVPLFCFAAPPIVRRIGEKWTMVIGAAGYIVFMASLIKPIAGVVKAASVVVGFGAAILWVAVGPYITKASTERTVGRNNGIFWGILQLSNVLGNLGAYFVFDNLGGSYALFLSLTAVGGLALLLFCFIKPTSKFKRQHVHQDPLQRHPKSVWQDIKATLIVMQTNEILLLLFIFMFTGLELAFWSGEFSQMLDSSVIGLVLCFTGVGEMVGSFLTNRLTDRVGCSWMLFTGAVVYGVGLTLVSFIERSPPGLQPRWQGASWMAYVAAFSFGVGDSCINTQIYALIGVISRGSTMVKAFTVFQMFQNLGSALGYYMGTQLPMHGDRSSLAQVYIQALVLFIGTLFFVRVDVRHKRRQQQEHVEERMHQDERARGTAQGVAVGEHQLFEGGMPSNHDTQGNLIINTGSHAQ